MHDVGKVITGLVIFIALVLSPVWYQAARGAETGPPELERAIDGPDCVADSKFMRALHMDLLDVWRDEADGGGTDCLRETLKALDHTDFPRPLRRVVVAISGP